MVTVSPGEDQKRSFGGRASSLFVGGGVTITSALPHDLQNIVAEITCTKHNNASCRPWVRCSGKALAMTILYIIF